MSDPRESLTDDVISVQDVIQAYLLANPTPSDQELHSLAETLGYTYQEFEELVFKMLKDAVDEADEDDLDEVIEDPLDLFIVSFLSWATTPTEEQVHALATLVNLTPEALEERMYELLSGLSGLEEDADD